WCSGCRSISCLSRWAASKTRAGRATSAPESEAEDALGVAVEDLLHHFVLVAELPPLPQDPLVRHARIVAAEHDLVLQAAAHVDLEVAGKVFRRPAGHLPVDVALVQRHCGGLLDPRPA